MWWYRINIRCSRAEVTGNVYTPKTSLNFVVWFSVFLRLSRSLSAPAIGLTENAGRENDGPSKLQGMKLQDMKLADQFAGHEIAGHENEGPICTT